MHTVSQSLDRFHSYLPARGEHNAPSLIPSGHVDEILLDHADDDARAAAYWQEFEQGLADAADDHLAQLADEAHTRALADAVSHAKALAGNVAVVVSRTLADQGGDFPTVGYTCTLTGADTMHVGVGATPRDAVEHAVEVIDLVYLTGSFGGFKVTGLAFVSGFPHRQAAEARQIARRIAMDPAYLDVALAVKLDGLTDLRSPRPSAVAA